MRKLARTFAVSLASLFASQAFATDDFRVVVPLYGKKAVNAGIALGQSDLPPGVVGAAYPDFDFKTLLTVISDSPVDLGAVTWSAVSVLPEGMSVSADGILVGTPGPSAVTSAPFTLSATYAGKSTTQNYTLPVTAVDVVEQPPEGTVIGGQEQVSDGAAVLTVAPTKIAFGNVAKQLPTEPVKVSIRNTGTNAGTVAIGPPVHQEYVVTHNCPVSLPVGGACEASVVFTPATIYNLKSSFSVNLGQQGAQVVLSGTGNNSAITFTHLPNKGSYQNFGIVAADQIVARQTIIKNTSRYYALGLFDVAVNPSSSAESQFHIENTECPKVLQVGESCTFTPVFAPTKKGEYSVYSKLKVNVSGNVAWFQMYGRSAGSLKVTKVSSLGAQLAGGQEITIYGDGIQPGAKVFFGETEAATRGTGTTAIYATVPPVDQPENTYIRIENPDGAEASAPVPFKRARMFGRFSVTGPFEYGKQAVNVPSVWQTVSLYNEAYASKDALTISDIQVSGPYQVDTTNGYCAPGKVINRGYSCTMRIRFIPSADGAAPGDVTVVANGEPLKLQLNGTGLAWDGTPSGSATENTEPPYNTVLSGNEPVGGASQTKLINIYFRNTNPAAQLNAYFKLADGSVFKFYSLYKIGPSSSTNTYCLPSSTAKESTLCRASVGSGLEPHLGVRLQATSAAGVGTFYDELIVLNAAGEEQYRIPLWLDVVYDVSVQPYSDFKNTTPVNGILAEKVPLAQEGYSDIWLVNVGTHGMLKTESVTLVDKSSPDIYLKSNSLLRATPSSASTSQYLDTCGQLVSTDEHSGCLSDDVIGTGVTYKNQRVRVYFKPMSAGARTATLRIAHRGQGDNPLDLPVTIRPFEFNGVFSAKTAAAEATEVPVTRLSANYEVDQTNTQAQVNFYLNSTDSSPMKGYFVLSGAGTESTNYTFNVIPVNDTGSTSSAYCALKSRAESDLCASGTTYQNYKFGFTINSKMGAGTYNWTLTFYDPAMSPVTSLPFVIEILNDNQPEVSLDWLSAQPIPDGGLNFGTMSVPTAPGQTVPPAVTQKINIRNLGQYGKMRIDRVYIEGGDGAFTFPSSLHLVHDSSTARTTAYCTPYSTKLDSYNVTTCTASDPRSSPYTTVGATIAYKPLTTGTQQANLVIWHNSTVVANPIVVPLVGGAVGDPVAGEVSSVPGETLPPVTDFGTFTKSGGSKNIAYFFRNPGPYGALYAEWAVLEGSSYFKLNANWKASKTPTGYSSCGSTLAADGRSYTACLADTYDTTATNRNIRYNVTCAIPSAAPAGTYTATLRVKTQGAEHAIPLTCSKS